MGVCGGWGISLSGTSSLAEELLFVRYTDFGLCDEVEALGACDPWIDVDLDMVAR